MRGDKFQYKEQMTAFAVIINLREQHTQEVHATHTSPPTTAVPLSGNKAVQENEQEM